MSNQKNDLFCLRQKRAIVLAFRVSHFLWSRRLFAFVIYFFAGLLFVFCFFPAVSLLMLVLFYFILPSVTAANRPNITVMVD